MQGNQIIAIPHKMLKPGWFCINLGGFIGQSCNFLPFHDIPCHQQLITKGGALAFAGFETIIFMLSEEDHTHLNKTFTGGTRIPLPIKGS